MSIDACTPDRRRPGGLARRAAHAAVLALLVAVAACAARVPPPLPAALAYPEFLFPVIPPPLAQGDAVEHVDFGWRYLQNRDLANAEREFRTALERMPGLYPAQTGMAYVEVARNDHDDALAAFDAALRLEPRYVPALVGRGQSALALGRNDEAVAAFEAALAADSSLADLRSRIEVLRFRSLQDVIERARSAAQAGQLEEARAQYARALEASPESAFLHRELGLVERRRGAAPAALGHFRRAADLDPYDATALAQIGELLEAQGDLAGAEAAYRKAAAIEPSDTLTRRIAAVAEAGREARLPAEFQAISASTQVTRGELAALLGVRFEAVLASVPPREVVMTDTRGHWAASWIAQAARAGVMEPFPNHTFQPRARVTRGDLAAAVSRTIQLLAAQRPELRAHLTARPRIADMPPGHLNYPAAAVAVASGVMPLAAGERFEVARPVSGAEAVETIARLRALASTFASR